MSKFYQTFQSPYSLPKPPQTILFHTTFFSEFVVKYPKTSSFFWISQRRNSSLTKTTESCLFLPKKYLTVANLSNITLSFSQPFHHLCLLLAKKLASQKQSIAFNGTILLLLTRSPNAINFFISLCFMSFFRFFRFRLLDY